MTDVPIRVSISSREAIQGKTQVVRSLDDIRKSAANTNEELKKIGPGIRKSTREAVSGLDLLKRTLYTLGGVAILHKIVDLSNTFGDLRNKVLLATGSIQQANSTLERLFVIANKNRAPIEELTSLYQKASITSKELGASQEDLFKFTQLVAQGLAIQGGSAQTASGALLQLSQSLGSGIVRAEEFNSVLEGAFPIAQAAARGLDAAGGSVAKLRQLVVNGQVTSKDFFKALLSQADDLQSTFSKIEPTLRSAGIVFKNNLIAQFEKSQGVFALLAKGIIFLAENLDTLIRIATVAGIALLTAFAPTIIGVAIAKITLAVNILTAAIAANPIGALAVAITAAASALVVFSDKIQLSSNKLANLQDLLSVFWSDAKEKFSQVGDFISGMFDALPTKFKNLVGEFDFSVEGMLRIWAKFGDRVIGIYKGVYNVIVSYFKQFPRVIADIFNQAMNNAIHNVERAINTISKGLNNLPGVKISPIKLESVKNPYSGSASGFGKTLKQSFLKGYNTTTISDYIDSSLSRAEDKAKARAVSPLSEKIDLGKAVQGEDVAVGKIGKVKDAMKDFGSTAIQTFNDFDYTFQSILGHFEDQMVSVLRTGKFNFKDFVNSALDDLARLAVQQSITKPLYGAFSGVATNFLGSYFGAKQVAAPSSSFVGPMPQSQGFFSGFGFDQGIDYVPRDMMAMLHKGEKVITSHDNRKSEAPITVNLIMPNVTDYPSFRQNQAQASAGIARSLQSSIRRNG